MLGYMPLQTLTGYYEQEIVIYYLFILVTYLKVTTIFRIYL